MATTTKIDIGTLRSQVSNLNNTATILESALNKNKEALNILKDEFAMGAMLGNILMMISSTVPTMIQKQCEDFNRALNSFNGADQELRKEITDYLDQSIANGILNDVRHIENSYRIPHSIYSEYRDQLNRANNAPGLSQHRCTRNIPHQVYAGKKQSDNDASICTTVCSTQLVNRMQALSGSDQYMTVAQAIGFQEATSKSKPWNFSHNATYEIGGNTYQTSELKVPAGMSNTEYLQSQLLQHPEGIEYYADGHAVVITDYEVREDGSIQFYAIDGVGYYSDDGYHSYEATRVPLEQTWMFHENHGQAKDGAAMINSHFTWFVGVTKAS